MMYSQMYTPINPPPFYHSANEAEILAEKLIAVKNLRPNISHPNIHGSMVSTITGGDSNVQAYAKLQGEDFTYYMQTLAIVIGRRATPDDEVDVDLGRSKLISRQHVRIEYNFQRQRFELKCLGKNGVYVDGRFHTRDHEPIMLETKTLIQIGEKCFYFLLPLKPTQDIKPLELEPKQETFRRLSTISSPFGSGCNTPGTLSPMSSAPPSPISDEKAEYRLNPGVKPPYSYASLIAQAIFSQPDRRLTLSGIYNYIQENYPFYRFAQNGWQNSIRHNLSLNKAFLKIPRRDDEPGKGAWWTVDSAYEHMFMDGIYRKRPKSSKPSCLLRTASTGNLRGSPLRPSEPRKHSLTSLLIAEGSERKRIKALLTQTMMEEDCFVPAISAPTSPTHRHNGYDEGDSVDDEDDQNAGLASHESITRNLTEDAPKLIQQYMYSMGDKMTSRLPPGYGDQFISSEDMEDSDRRSDGAGSQNNGDLDALSTNERVSLINTKSSLIISCDKR